MRTYVLTSSFKGFIKTKNRYYNIFKAYRNLELFSVTESKREISVKQQGERTSVPLNEYFGLSATVQKKKKEEKCGNIFTEQKKQKNATSRKTTLETTLETALETEVRKVIGKEEMHKNTGEDENEVEGADDKEEYEEAKEKLKKLILSIQKLNENEKGNIIQYINTLNKKYLENVKKEINVFFENLDEYLSFNGLLICDIGGEEILNYLKKVNVEESKNTVYHEKDKERTEMNKKLCSTPNSITNTNTSTTTTTTTTTAVADNVNLHNLFDETYIREKKKSLYGDSIYPIIQNDEKSIEKLEDVNECSSIGDEEEWINIRRQILIERSSYKKAIEEAEDFISNLHNLKKITEIRGLCKIYLSWVKELEKKIHDFREEKRKKKRKCLFPPYLENRLLAIIAVKWCIQYTFNPVKKKYSNDVTTQSKHFEHTYSYQSLFTHIAIKIGDEVNNELNFQILEKRNILHNFVKKNKHKCSFSSFHRYKMMNQYQGRTKQTLFNTSKCISRNGKEEINAKERNMRMEMENYKERGHVKKKKEGLVAEKESDEKNGLIHWNTIKKAAIGGTLLQMLIDNATMDVDVNTAKQEYKNEYKYYLYLHKTGKNHKSAEHETECKYRKELSYQKYYEDEAESLKFVIVDKDSHHMQFGDRRRKEEANENMSTTQKRENLNFSQKQKEKLANKKVILFRSPKDKSKIELPIFIHSYIWKNNNWYGVIHMRECCASYLLNSAVHSHVPLNYLPMVCKPKRWVSMGNKKGDITEKEKKKKKEEKEKEKEEKDMELEKRVRGKIEGKGGGGMLLLRNNFIRCNIKPLFDLNVCDMSRVQNIVSEIGNVQWKIHKEILHYIEYAYMKGINIGKIPLNTNYSIPKKYQNINFQNSNNEEIRKYYLLKEEVNRLNKSLISERPTFLQKLAVAKTLKNSKVIYFPHNIDFRGRMYPLSPHLHHMSDDICRSLIVFYEKKEIGKNGLFWLKIHLANCFGKDKLNFEKRIQWVNENMDNVKKLSTHPFENREFWKKSEKPWQALAVAIDLVNALNAPNVEKYKSNIPIQQDGTCNGLQHYAALGKDADGGKAVNIIPCDEPQDIYTVVLNIVIKKIEKEVQKNIYAKYCFDFNLLKRKVVKQTIMTICYGVTSIGAKNQVKGKIQNMIGKDLDENSINKLSQYIAKYIFESISEIFDRAMIIKKWFNNLSKVTNDMNIPVTWISPVGLPCEQPYRIGKRILVKTPVQSISVISYKNTELDKNKQRLGFPPNFVHSLDASHLMMTAEKMLIHNNFSFAAVHDSYWTHACNVDIMNSYIRDTFIELYEKPILQNIYNNFKNRLGVCADKISPPPEQGDLNIWRVRDSRYFFS